MQLYFMSDVSGEVLRRFQVNALFTMILLERIASTGAGDATFNGFLALLLPGISRGIAGAAGVSGTLRAGGSY